MTHEALLLLLFLIYHTDTPLFSSASSKHTPSQFPNGCSTSPHLKSWRGLARLPSYPVCPPHPSSGLLPLTTSNNNEKKKKKDHSGILFSKYAKNVQPLNPEPFLWIFKLKQEGERRPRQMGKSPKKSCKKF